MNQRDWFAERCVRTYGIRGLSVSVNLIAKSQVELLLVLQFVRTLAQSHGTQ